MDNSNNTTKSYSLEHCDKIILELTDSLTTSSTERALDCSMMQVREVLLNGSADAKEYIFELVFEKFQFFIKKRIANLFVMNTDKEDLMQEATLCFYNSILKYDIQRGAFICFTKTYIARNIWGLITKSRKHIRNNVSFVSIDGYGTCDDGKSNFDDHLYYQMGETPAIEESILRIEQTRDYMGKMDEILTEREKKAMYLYLKGASYEEIAEICDISEKSVDNSLHRAKTKLKSTYKDGMDSVTN